MKMVYHKVCEKEKNFLDEIQDVGDNAVSDVADLRLIPELLAQLHVPGTGEQNISQLRDEIKRAIRELGAEAKKVKLRYVYDLYADFHEAGVHSMKTETRKESVTADREKVSIPVVVGAEGDDNNNEDDDDDDEGAYYAEKIGSKGIIPTKESLRKIRPKLSRFPAIINVSKKATKFPFVPQPVVPPLFEHSKADSKDPAPKFSYELTNDDVEKIKEWVKIRSNRKLAAAYIARKEVETKRAQIGGALYHDIRKEHENMSLVEFGHKVKRLEGSGPKSAAFICVKVY